jgi:hypothetical protein
LKNFLEVCVRISTICALILVFAGSLYGRIINVPAEYATIQAGIDASVNGDTVLVAPGEYQENIQINGQEIALASSNGPYETTILGHIIISGFSDTASCTVQGFTQVGQDRNPYGGQPGVRINGGRPRIIGNIFTNNGWQGCGGAIFIPSGRAIIRHNIINDNWAVGWGGGIGFWSGSDVEISYNIITHNESGLVFELAGNGGGIMADGAANIFYNLIYNNQVQCYSYGNVGCGQGGGVLLYHPHSHIYNNTIVQNYVHRSSPNPPYEGGEGSGIYAIYWASDTLILENNIIAFNRRGGLHLRSEGNALLMEQYNLLFGNTLYDIVAPETSSTDIFADPLFIDTAQNDYRLQSNSPCIDTGNPEYPPDPDSTRIDIGALFYDQSVDIIEPDENRHPIDFRLTQNYPNPFNAKTTISYILPNSTIVNLLIYDLTGKIVKRLVINEAQEQGAHKYVWDGTDEDSKQVTTSIYFYELKASNLRVVKSMILVK